MSILTENSKKMLVESMRECLSEVLHESTSLTSKQATEKIKFITESATYEQLLNITLNPHRQEKYQPAYVLEGAVAILHSACMTGRKHIGINAITEGALKLQKKTGAVITESMLDAALTAVNEGAGLKVIGKILQEFDSNLTHWNQILNGLPAAERGILDAEVAAMRAGNQQALSAQAKSILARHTGKNAATIEKFFGAAGSDPQLFRQQRLLDNLRSKISAINSRVAKGTATASDTVMLTRLKNQADVLSKTIGNGGSSGANNALKTLQNSGAGKTPWGKIALGAAAAAGTGALAYQYYKNRKAMNRDIQNGIQQ